LENAEQCMGRNRSTGWCHRPGPAAKLPGWPMPVALWAHAHDIVTIRGALAVAWLPMVVWSMRCSGGGGTSIGVGGGIYRAW
jgi:hypothetical protein